MSKVCAICGKGQQSGNKVSHSNRKYRRSKVCTYAQDVCVKATLNAHNI